MQIQLKQTEIVIALKQYITQQGIDLTGKEVSITFTAGRKESGISADLAIDDIDIPGFSSSVGEPVSLALVPDTGSHAAPEPVGLPEIAVAEPVEPVAKSVSLFN